MINHQIYTKLTTQKVAKGILIGFVVRINECYSFKMLQMLSVTNNLELRDYNKCVIFPSVTFLNSNMRNIENKVKIKCSEES